MSIQGFRRFLVGGPVLKTVLYILIFVFVVGLAAIFTPNSGMFGDRTSKEQTTAAGANDVIAKVDGKPITRAAFEKIYTDSTGQMMAMYAQYGMRLGLRDIPNFRLGALEEAINQQLLLNDAAKQGIRVTKRDVSQRIQQLADLQLAQVKQQAKDRNLEQILGQLYSQATQTERPTMSERQFRKWMVSDLQEKYADQVESELITSKLRDKVAPKPAVTEAEVLSSYDTVTVRTIFVGLNPTGKPVRTDAQARARAAELVAQAKKPGVDFAKLAAAESEQPQAKTTGGLRDKMPMSAVTPAWQKALSSLKEGEIAPEPIKDASGYTVLKLEKRGRDLPKDFEKNKQQELDRLASTKQSQVWGQYQQGLRAKAKIQVVDAELLGDQAMRAGKMPEALADWKKASEKAETMGPAGAASVYYQLATSYAQQGKWQDAASSYEQADNYLSREGSGLSASRPETLMGMAQAYEKLGNTTEAMIWYRAAGDAAQDPGTHQQLQMIYQKMGQKQDADREAKWVADYQKQQAEAQQKALQAQQKAAAAAQPGTPQPAGQPQAGKPAAQAPAPAATTAKPATAPAKAAAPAKKPAAPMTAPVRKPAASSPAPAPAAKPAAPAPGR